MSHELTTMRIVYSANATQTKPEIRCKSLLRDQCAIDFSKSQWAISHREGERPSDGGPLLFTTVNPKSRSRGPKIDRNSLWLRFMFEEYHDVRCKPFNVWFSSRLLGLTQICFRCKRNARTIPLTVGELRRWTIFLSPSEAGFGERGEVVTVTKPPQS
jgi:hypothetical protein